MIQTNVPIPPRGMARVLVIDDEERLAWTFGKILSMAGYDVVTMTNPLLVVEETRRSPVDLVISDVVMPQLSGIDLAIQLRQQDPDSRMILLSGQANTVKLMDKAQQLGFHFEVFAKPISPTDLLRIVRERVRGPENAQGD